MSYGAVTPNCCRIWLPDAILCAGRGLHDALVGHGDSSNFAHLQAKYPQVVFNILGSASLSLPLHQRLHIEAKCSDPGLLDHVESDLIDLAETACDMAGDAIGMSDDQVQDIFEMIRSERYVATTGVAPAGLWSPQAYELELRKPERPAPGASAKSLPQKRPAPPSFPSSMASLISSPLDPLMIKATSSAPPPVPKAIQAPLPKAPILNGGSAPGASSGAGFIIANIAAASSGALAPPATAAVSSAGRRRGSRGPWGESIAKALKVAEPPASAVPAKASSAPVLDLGEDLSVLPDLDEASTPEMELDEEELGDSLRLLLGSDFTETPEAAPVEKPATEEQKQAKQPEATDAKKKSGKPTATARKAGSPAVPPINGAGARKLPPVPVFEAIEAKNGEADDKAVKKIAEAAKKIAEAAKKVNEVDDKAVPKKIVEADEKPSEPDAQVEAEKGSASGSSGSSSGSEEEDEEEDDEGAEDEEVDADAQNNGGLAGTRTRLYKLKEFCCAVTAVFSSGCKTYEALLERFDIDQRIKTDRCRLHLEQAGDQVTVWHLSVAGKKGRAQYQALCDYFVDKERVGLVDTPSYYMYVVPPGGKFLSDLGLTDSKVLVGIQVPKDRTDV